MKTLESLRQMKASALDRMEALNLFARKEGRDLNAVENAEYRLNRSRAEDLNAAIAVAEVELHESAPAPTPVSVVPREIDFSPRDGFDRHAPFLRIR